MRLARGMGDGNLEGVEFIEHHLSACIFGGIGTGTGIGISKKSKAKVGAPIVIVKDGMDRIELA